MAFGNKFSTSLALQPLIAAIPIVSDGDVITSEYQNAVRGALLLLAGAIGDVAPPVAVDVTENYAPVFQPVAQAGQVRPQWMLGLGIASKPVGEDAEGWFQIHLPDGATIKSMAVSGARGGAVLSSDVTLLRQTIASSTKTPMINISLKPLNGTFTTPPAEITGASPAVIEEFRTVDNDRYQYLIRADINGAGVGAQVDLYGIQVSYTR